FLAGSAPLRVENSRRLRRHCLRSRRAAAPGSNGPRHAQDSDEVQPAPPLELLAACLRSKEHKQDRPAHRQSLDGVWQLDGNRRSPGRAPRAPAAPIRGRRAPWHLGDSSASAGWLWFPERAAFPGDWQIALDEMAQAAGCQPGWLPGRTSATERQAAKTRNADTPNLVSEETNPILGNAVPKRQARRLSRPLKAGRLAKTAPSTGTAWYGEAWRCGIAQSLRCRSSLA